MISEIRMDSRYIVYQVNLIIIYIPLYNNNIIIHYATDMPMDITINNIYRNSYKTSVMRQSLRKAKDDHDLKVHMKVRRPLSPIFEFKYDKGRGRTLTKRSRSLPPADATQQDSSEEQTSKRMRTSSPGSFSGLQRMDI